MTKIMKWVKVNLNLDPTIVIHAVLLFLFLCIICIPFVVHKVIASIRIRQKSKGVTLSTLCKVLSFPRWVYFRTGRAGFRSRRDMSEDRANTHTLVNTCVMCNHGQKRKDKCTSTHAHTHTRAHTQCLQAGADGSIGIQGHLSPISWLSQHTSSLHCPRGRRIMHKTKHVGTNN